MTDQQTPKGVVALVQSNVGTRKTRILLAATELFVACEAPDSIESHVFAELFRQYITQTPIEERRRIASLLARCEYAPHETILTLMRDEDASVAHRVVAYSPVLTSCELVAAVGRGPEALRRAVTLRSDLTLDVIAALKRHAEPQTLAGLSLSGRATPASPPPRDDAAPSARTSEAAPAAPSATEETADMPDRDTPTGDSQAPGQDARTQLHAALQARLETTLQTGDLRFLRADSRERARAITAAQGRVMAEMATRGVSGGARATSEPDLDMLRCLEQSAMARDKETFLGLLAPMLDVDTATAERITLDAGGEPLTVALASLGLATSRTIAVMIQMSPAAYGIERLREISALRANLDRRTARLIANDWRRTPVTETPVQHQPLLDASQRPNREAAIDSAAARPASKAPRKDDVLVLRDVAN